MYERWRHEREAQGAQVDPITPADRRAPPSRIAAFHRELGLRLSEDYVILTQSQSGSHDAIILHHVCFPSRWRPERSLGRDFRTIHAPVPNFEGVMVRADAWVRTLVSRGPYVRFVWTVTAAPALDQHPDIAHRTSTLDLSEAFLRVERQVSVPFPHQHSCLFLIRVYVYPLQSLKDTQLQTLASALHQMPEAIRRYKGLEHSWRGFAAAIERRLR